MHRYWSQKRIALVRRHWLNDAFLADLDMFLKRHAPKSVHDAFKKDRSRPFWDFPTRVERRGKGYGSQWDDLLFESLRMRRRWPFMPEKFWLGTNKLAVKNLYQLAWKEWIEDPAITAEPEGTPEMIADSRAARGQSLFERVRVVIPIYEWSTADQVSKVAAAAVQRAKEFYKKKTPYPRRTDEGMELSLEAIEVYRETMDWAEVLMRLSDRWKEETYKQAAVYAAERKQARARGMKAKEIFKYMERKFTGAWETQLGCVLDRLHHLESGLRTQAQKLGPFEEPWSFPFG